MSAENWSENPQATFLSGNRTPKAVHLRPQPSETHGATAYSTNRHLRSSIDLLDLFARSTWAPGDGLELGKVATA